MTQREPWHQRSLEIPFVVWIALFMGLILAGSFAACISLSMKIEEALGISVGIAIGSFLVFTVGYAIIMFLLRWTRRVAVERAVIAHIANIIRQKLPLAPAMAVAARSERGIAAHYLEAMSVYLAAGVDLPEAIRLGWPGCPSMVLSLIIAGQQSGQLPLAVRQAQEYVTWQARRRERGDVPVAPYALIVTLATCLATTGMMVAVIPKFKEIFKDFGTRLPPLTITLIEVGEWVAALIGPLLLLLVAGVIAGIYLGFRPRRVPEPRLISRLADWIKWHIPGLHRLEKARGLATSMEAIRMGVLSGMNLPAATLLAADMDVNYQLRMNLRRFAERVTAGVDIRTAAAGTHLSSVAAIALAGGQRSGDMDTALSYATDYHLALFSRTWIILTRLAWPVTTLALGIIVAFVVVAMFLPLVVLINSVSGGW